MKNNYTLACLLIFGVQLLICNYLHVSQYLTLSLLPCMIMLMPASYKPARAMLTAFIAGILVDLLSDGVAGLNAFALVPVAGLRTHIYHLVFGQEMTINEEDVSLRKYGVGKVTMAMLFAQGIFLALYILFDGFFVRPLSFSALRFIVSLIAGILVSLILANVLDPSDRR